MNIKIRITKPNNTSIPLQEWRVLNRRLLNTRNAFFKNFRQVRRFLGSGAAAANKKRFDDTMKKVDKLIKKKKRTARSSRNIRKNLAPAQLDNIKQMTQDFSEIATVFGKKTHKDVDANDVNFLLRRTKDMDNLLENINSRLAKLEEAKKAKKITKKDYDVAKKRLIGAQKRVTKAADLGKQGIKKIAAPKKFWTKKKIIAAGAAAGLIALATAYGLFNEAEGVVVDDDDDDPEPEPEPAPDPGPVPVPVPGGGGAPGTCAEFYRLAKKTLGKSAKEATKDIQNKLIELGYKLPKYGVDGECGKETRGAVAQFQRDMKKKGKDLGSTGPNKDGIDGIVGPITWALMTGADTGKADGDKKDKKEVGGKGKCNDEASFKSMSIVDKLNCAWKAVKDAMNQGSDQVPFAEIVYAHQRFRNSLRVPFGRIMFDSTEARAKYPEGVTEPPEDRDQAIAEAINKVFPMPKKPNTYEQTLAMVNQMKAAAVSSTEQVEVAMRDPFRKTRARISYMFTYGDFLQELEAAIDREIKPYKKMDTSPGDIRDPKGNTAKKKFPPGVPEPGLGGIIAQLPQGKELAGEGALPIKISDKKVKIKFGRGIDLSYGGKVFNFIYEPKWAEKLVASKQAAKIKSAKRVGNDLVVTLAVKTKAGERSKTYKLSDKDLISLLSQTNKIPSGVESKVRLGNEEGKIKRVSEGRYYDLDFSKWEKMFK